MILSKREAGTIGSAGLVLTLAASMSFAAYAQTKTQNVTVVNPATSPVNTTITNAVVPVEVRNADPISVNFTESVTLPADAAVDFIADGTRLLDLLREKSFGRDAVITNAVIYAGVGSPGVGDCKIVASLRADPP